MSEKIWRQFGCSKMMLPEHCTMLREQTAADEWTQNHPLPACDEQLQEEQQRTLEAALAEGRPVKVQTQVDQKIEQHIAIPVSCDFTAGRIMFSASGRVFAIQAVDITSIDFA